MLLVRFILDEQNLPQGEVQAVAEADEQGKHLFEGLSTNPRAVFQVFAQLDEKVWKSKLLAFDKTAKSDAQLNAKISLPVATVPSFLSPAESALFIQEAVLATEAQVGGIWITEVLHWSNKTPLSWEAQPIHLPKEARYAEIIYLAEGIKHRFEGSILLLSGELPSGEIVTAYRYFLPAWWGSKTIRRKFPVALRQLSLITPDKLLQAEGASLQPALPRNIDGVTWQTWQRSNIPPQTTITMNINQIPQPPQIWLLLLPIMLLPIILLTIKMSTIR